MNEVQYNWLMGTMRDYSFQQSLLFDSPSLEEENRKKQATNSPEHILKTIFGYNEFRPLQREVIQNVLDGRDTLAVMPTGGGKSLCYEIPSLILSGLTIVVSPLIALMQDQVAQLLAVGIPAVFLNSTLDYETYRNACSQIISGKIKILYVSPESLRTERIKNLLLKSSLAVQCITIDEAHCISEWGHDFRPDYCEIASIRSLFPKAVCLALTATATKNVRDDIISMLKMETPAVLVASFNRPNLFLEVKQKKNPFAQLLEFLLDKKDECGIVYCFSRKNVDELYQKLLYKNFSVTRYHAGLSDEERALNQKSFISDNVNIMIATVAFGMGINKIDVRFVVHYDMPKSVEQYYQEIGRAGRDGLASHALLLYSLGDLQKIRYFFTEKDDPENSERLLQGMINYAESRGCRRQKLLSYFGEFYDEKGVNAVAEDCCCDVCLRGPLEERNVTVLAQKFMSCILRTEERYGGQYIIDILLGSKNNRIVERGHTKLSTYGIGKELSKENWFELCSALIFAGYISKTDTYNVLFLTKEGHKVLRERKEIFLPVEFATEKKVLPKKKTTYFSFTDNEKQIIEALSLWRKKRAEELSVPRYIVLGDKALYDIAKVKPTNIEELESCYGIGMVKAQKFGDAIIRIIEENIEQ